MSALKDWTPESEWKPSRRDLIAMNEHSMPNWSPEQRAEFIGVNPLAWNDLKHTPMFVAKWRYMMADAMLKEGGYG